MSRYVKQLVVMAVKDLGSGVIATGLALWKTAKLLGHGLVSLGRKFVHEEFRGMTFWRRDGNKQPREDYARKALAPRQIKRRWKILSGLGSTALVMFAIGVIVNLRFAAAVLPEDEVDLWTINRPPSLTFLDRHGDMIGHRGILYADPVPLDEMPPFLVDAFVSTEDRRFYGHRGYDLKGLIRATLANMRAGTVVEGGSTITQQLAKNLFLEPERTLSRKLEELQFALWLEARLTKDEILSIYLNRIYLGSGTYGVEAAAQTYFSKSARELSLSEAAMIAGLPQAPSVLSPKTNPAGAILRSQEVIDNLLETKRVDEVEALAAKAYPPELNFTQRPDTHGYFLDYVAARIEERLGGLTQDLIVSTTFDPAIQLHAEAALNAGIDDKAQERNAEQAALIAFDRDGGIAAMTGGLDYTVSQFNRTTQARRQPGSAFKPFVYLAAMEAGLSPDSVLVDQPIKVGSWSPTNYTNRHRGPMRLSSAAAMSTNSIAVQITEAIGRERVVDAARRAGITDELPAHPSIALGTIELPLLDLTAAYMPFAHHGAERPAHAVVQIRTRNDEVLYQFEPIENYNVIEPSKADETTRLLMGVMTKGTGIDGRFGNHPVAGKTGTTNDWRDAWFIGFTHYYTVGVWVGNDQNQPMARVSGSTIPLAIWRDFMQRAHQGLTPRSIVDQGKRYKSSVNDIAGLYTSLRADLMTTAYPLPDIDWDAIEGEERPKSRRRFLIFGPRADPKPQEPQRVVGNAAPGLEELEEQ